METKHTPGPWIVKHLQDKGINAKGRHYEILHPLVNETGEYAGKIGGYHTVIGDKNCEPGYILSETDANFIAEAGTVATETGLTPRQLAEQRAALFTALCDVIESFAHIDGDTKGNKARTAIIENCANMRIAINKAYIIITKVERKE